MITQLTNAFRVIEARRIDLDRRSIALPRDDMDGRDALMVGLEAVFASRQVTLHRLALTQSKTLSKLRFKGIHLARPGGAR